MKTRNSIQKHWNQVWLGLKWSHHWYSNQVYVFVAFSHFSFNIKIDEWHDDGHSNGFQIDLCIKCFEAKTDSKVDNKKNYFNIFHIILSNILHCKWHMIILWWLFHSGNYMEWKLNEFSNKFSIAKWVNFDWKYFANKCISRITFAFNSVHHSICFYDLILI